MHPTAERKAPVIWHRHPALFFDPEIWNAKPERQCRKRKFSPAHISHKNPERGFDPCRNLFLDFYCNPNRSKTVIAGLGEPQACGAMSLMSQRLLFLRE